MSVLEFTLLSFPRIAYQQQTLRIPERKAVALLCYLALEETPQRRDFLAALLWPDSDDEHARGVLRKVLVRLREILPDQGVLLTDRSTLALRADYSSDWHQLKVAAREPSRYSLAQLEETAKLYRGELLENLNLEDSPRFDGWLQQKREQALQTQDRLLEHLGCVDI